MTQKADLLTQYSVRFAIEIIRTCQRLVAEREYVLSRQLARSGTSIGACIRESKNAESRKDFIHKLSISQKECAETMYWLDLLLECGYMTPREYNHLNNKASELLRLIRSSILTTKAKLTSQDKSTTQT